MLQLYDLAGLYFRAFYALPDSLVGPHGKPVNAIRGSLDILAKMIADGRPSRAIACLDVDWRPQWRVDLVPSYKAHRVAAADQQGPGATVEAALAEVAALLPAPADEAEAVPDALSPQVPVLLDVLQAVGIAAAGAPECEADDVIGTLATAERADPVEIVTGDRDLFQLVRAEPTPVTVRYIGAGVNRAEVMDDASLRDRYGVDGAGYAAMATLRGDASDGLPGVAGIGEKTAADLIRRFGSLTAVLAAADDPAAALTSAVRRRLQVGREYLAAAAPVVLVRTDATITRTLPTDALPDRPHDPDALQRLTTEHGLDTSVQRLVAALAG